jgi:hypothetical protein
MVSDGQPDIREGRRCLFAGQPNRAAAAAGRRASAGPSPSSPFGCGGGCPSLGHGDRPVPGAVQPGRAAAAHGSGGDGEAARVCPGREHRGLGADGLPFMIRREI